MAETVRIDPTTHARLAKIASSEKISLADALRRAVETLDRELFFRSIDAAYAAMTPTQWEEEEAERKAWDVALLDGLEQA